MNPEMVTRDRAVTAIALYLSHDRSDTAYAVHELSRRITGPCESDWATFKRLGRCRAGKRIFVTLYGYQSSHREFAVFTDIDFAGWSRLRTSTRGGRAMVGSHLLDGWCSTQGVCTLPSDEAELYAMVKGGSMGLKWQRLMQYLDIKMGIQINTGAGAVKGIANRTGTGKVIHIDVDLL